MVYTPRSLADAVVTSLQDKPTNRWLEPCFGRGVFLKALASKGVSSNRITAVDLDKEPSPADKLARTYRGQEFLCWASRQGGRFDRIVANPPYISISRLPPSLRKVSYKVMDPWGSPIGLVANIWYAFLCASLRLLKKGGNLSFILPASWEYADYCKKAREKLPAEFQRFEICRSRKPLFENVQDGTIIILGIGYRKQHNFMNRTEYADLQHLVRTLNAHPSPVRNLSALRKKQLPISENKYVRLGDVFGIRLGGVTGDVDYFLLTEQKRKELKLPVQALKPVLTKSKHLNRACVTKNEWRILRNRGERIWLFFPSTKLISHPSVRRYLDKKTQAGGCNRMAFKIKNRRPWYRTLLPKRVGGFISGMSRSGPWICFSAMPGLSATNTLYTIHFRKRLSEREKYSWALALLTKNVRAKIRSISRKYPGGLIKVEPGKLACTKILAPKIIRNSKGIYSRAIKLFLKGKIKQCEAICRIVYSSPD